MYFLRRLAYMIPLLLVISAVLFWLERLTPGNPFDREHAPASAQIRHNLEAKYHYDEPIWKQYLRYIGGVAHGDFGPSLKYRDHSVTDIVKQGLPVSMLLGWLAFGFAMGVGLPLGFITAVRRGRWQDHVGSIFALLAPIRTRLAPLRLRCHHIFANNRIACERMLSRSVGRLTHRFNGRGSHHWSTGANVNHINNLLNHE